MKKLKIKALLAGILLLLNLVNVSIVCATDSVLTLDEAIEEAINSTREVKKQELNTEKLKNKLYQANEDYDDVRYSDYYTLLNEYLYLQQKLAEGDTSVNARIAQLEKDMDAAKAKTSSQSQQIAAAYDKKRDAEDSYNDAKESQEQYEKRLEHIVKDLYTSILNIQGTLEAQEKEYEQKLLQVNIERKRLELGKSTQDKVDELAIQASNVNKNISNLRNSFKSLKGQLNDMLNRDYNASLELENFEVSSTAAVPAYQPLFEKASAQYSYISQLERDIEQKKEDLDDANYEDVGYQDELLSIHIAEMELQLEDERINLIDKSNQIIADFKEKQKAYQLAELEFKNAENAFLRDKKRFELGLISRLELLNSETNYKKAYNNKFSTGYAFYLVQNVIRLAEQGIFI